MGAHDYAMGAMQRTMQASQASRYIPPPSAPGGGMTWGGTMNALAGQQMNPYVANALGGGGMHLPAPMMSPQYGMYRQGGGRMGGAPFSPMMAPAVYNPYVAFPQSNFTSPTGRDYANLQALQGRGSAALLGGIQGGMEMGGSLAGGAVGSALGAMIPLPGMSFLGGMAGSYLGGKMGGALAGPVIDPVLQDLSRGRQVQNMTSPFMMTGPNLNMMTGQGMNRQAGLETAIQLRNVTRDADFHRQTGFNQQDMMKLTNLAGEQGLLDTARDPEMIARRMKDIAKSVKALIQITHDPDVRAAMADLGQLRNLGFEGTQGQMGAAANRASFARMAGMSQQAIGAQFGMPGAMAAQGLGLAGSTGYMAGVSGAGMANVGVSAGAFSDLQLSRAGGRAGISQTNMMAALGASNQDIYMAASLKRGPGGLSVDTDAYRRAQGMNISDVAGEASRRMNEIGAQGISELATRKQEFKDILAKSQSPIQQQLNVLRQAQAMQRETGLNLGGALSVMIGSTEQGRGMGGAEREQMARTLELQYTSPEFYRGMNQQMNFERRNVIDRGRAGRAQSRTPSLYGQMGRNYRANMNQVSDFITEPTRAGIEGFDQTQEDIDAVDRGERLTRFDESELFQDERQRRRSRSALRGGGMLAAARRGRPGSIPPDPASVTHSMGRLSNMAGAAMRFNRVSDENLEGQIAFESLGGPGHAGDFGRSLMTSGASLLMPTAAAHARVVSLQGMAEMTARGRSATTEESSSFMTGLQGRSDRTGKTGVNFNSVIRDASRNLRQSIQTSGLFSSGKQVSALDVRKAAIAAMVQQGKTAKEAEALFDANPSMFGGQIVNDAMRFADPKEKEQLQGAMESTNRAMPLRGAGQDDVTAMRQYMRTAEYGSGFNVRKLSDKQIALVEKRLGKEDTEVLAYASLQQAAAHGSASAQKELERMEHGHKDVATLQRRAGALLDSMSEEERTLFGGAAGAASPGFAKRIGETQERLMGFKGTSAVSEGVQKLADQFSSVKRMGRIGTSGGDMERVMDTLAANKDELKETVKKLGGARGQALDEFAKAGGDASKRAAAVAKFHASFIDDATAEAEAWDIGGHNEKGMDQLKKDQDDLNSARGSAGVDKTFADGADKLLEAANKLLDAANSGQLENAHPYRGGT